MDNPLITVTLEVRGTDDELLSEFHAQMHAMLKRWRACLVSGELTITYQDGHYMSVEAELEDDDETGAYE